MEKKRDRSTKKQLYTLVDYISNNKDMVYPSNDVSTFNNYEEKWEDISKILNAMEGPKKHLNNGNRYVDAYYVDSTIYYSLLLFC